MWIISISPMKETGRSEETHSFKIATGDELLAKKVALGKKSFGDLPVYISNTEEIKS